MTTTAGECRLAVLDVGHGSSALVTSARDAVVIDAGPGGAVLLEYLAERDVRFVSTVLISHADSDHLRGLIALLGTGMEVRRVVLNSDAAKGTKLWDDVLYELDQRQRAGAIEFDVAIVEGDEIAFDDEAVSIHVLAPRRYLAGLGPGATDRNGNAIETNTISAVVRVDHDARPIALLTGDLDGVGLAHLLDSGNSLAARVLVFPHHGGSSSRSGDERANEEFARLVAESVQPELVAFSLGRHQHGTPRPEIVRGVQQGHPGARILCTQLSGRCAEKVPSFDPGHPSPLSRGKRERRCCAGTLEIELRSFSVLTPDLAQHQEFITMHVPSALCRD